ncbi:hypothetical protein ACP70R_042791 [Stipagrostis hirtigluma subsp. patula]
MSERCQPPNSSSPLCSGKVAWPELRGKRGKEAEPVIKEENPNIDAVICVPRDALVSQDYCCNRVWVYVDCKSACDYENAEVVRVPKVG